MSEPYPPTTTSPSTTGTVDIPLPRRELVLTDPPYGINHVSNSGAGRAPITNDGARLSLRLYRSVLPLLDADHVLWFDPMGRGPFRRVDLGQWFPDDSCQRPPLGP